MAEEGKLMPGEPKEQKCRFVDCNAVGIPEPGYSFFACAACLDMMAAVRDAVEARTVRAGLVS